MTSEHLWQLASAATRKRLQALSGDLEARSIKLDRKLRDAKRRKPSKNSAAAAAAAASNRVDGVRAQQQGGKGPGRRSEGKALNERNGGAAACDANGAGTAVAAAASAAAAAVAVAKSERVKALNVDSRAIRDLHRSVSGGRRELW